MRNALIAAAAATMFGLVSLLPAAAMPVGKMAPAASQSDVIQVKGGHGGRGHGHGGWHRGNRGHHYGWHRGRGHHYGWHRGHRGHHGWHRGHRGHRGWR